MTPVRVLPPIKVPDPAGADRVVLAAAEAGAHWLENILLTQFRVPVDLWNGPNGLRGVLEEAVKNAGVPNKRFGEIVNPRSIAEGMKLIPASHKRKRRVSR